MSLSVEKLCFSYGRAPILRSVSFSVQKGEFLAVLGPNGAGKSTLFRCVLGTLTPNSGTILLDGQRVSGLSQKERAHYIAYIPQSHHPTFGYTVLDTALMGVTRQLGPFQQPNKAHVDQAMAALEQVGMARLCARNFAHLSGGEQQLVLIARALCQQAQILLMDEPTSSLDYGNQLRVLQQVQTLSRQGYAVILSTHNPQHALSFADRLLALEGGEVAADGPPGAALTPDLMRRLYGINVSLWDSPGGRILVPDAGGMR